MIELRIVYNHSIRHHNRSLVLDWDDVARGQRCVRCGHVIGSEPPVPGVEGEDCWGPTQLLMLGVDQVSQEVRQAAGMVYLARCMYIHRRCADELTSREIQQLAQDTLDNLTGVSGYDQLRS